MTSNAGTTADPPTTLGEMKAQGAGLRCYCTECGRDVIRAAATIPLADDTPFAAIGPLLICRDCRSRKIMSSLVAPGDCPPDSRPPGTLVAAKEGTAP